MEQTELHQAWADWVAEMGDWHVFGTLTYDSTARDTVPGSDVARAHVRRWLGGGLRTIGRPVEAAVVALEFHKSGWPHFHPLLRLAGGLQPLDLTRMAQTWSRRHGPARLEIPRERADVCAYASKYLTKDLSRGDVIFWPRRGSLSVHQPGL